MFPTRHHFTLKRTRSRRRKLKSNIKQQTSRKAMVVECFQEILKDLRQAGTRFYSYTITELEPICQQMAIQRMPSTARPTDYCPFLCLFCQNLIYQPMTLSCGHTFCYDCVQDEQMSSILNCPRCPADLNGQVPSSISQAREKSFSKNCFLQQLFERSERLQIIYERISLCQQGKKEYINGNYQQAVEIFSKIIDQDQEDHLAYYYRAKTYLALKQHDEGLVDATRIIALKPQWAKGYLCQSEILFEMEHLTAALMSSLKALAIEPEDQIGKQIMARHLYAILHKNDESQDLTTLETEFQQFNNPTLSNVNTTEINQTISSNQSLTICKSTQSSTSCYCSQFDHKTLNPKDFECSICVALLWFPITTPCGHVFCRECLIRSVDNTQAACPMCKSSIEEFFPLLIQSHVNQTEFISKIIEIYFPNEYNERRLLYEQENMQGASIPRSLINDPTNTESIRFEIPIFTCVAAFPFCGCPLHVFEPRYRLMMRRAIETESRTFGMCAYDEQTETFTDYGTLLYIRGLVYTQDGRSIVDTIGQRRFRVFDRGMKDGYATAMVELIRDQPIEQHEFDDLFQLNRDIYKRVRDWFDQLDIVRKMILIRQLEEYPECDDLTEGSTDGPKWSWIMLNLLPIEQLLQYTALASQSFRIRLQMINDAIDFLLHQQQTATTAT